MLLLVLLLVPRPRGSLLPVSSQSNLGVVLSITGFAVFGLTLRALMNMNAHGYELNLLLAWLWIALGILSGMLLGLGFHHEDWLGGYGSLRRRLYRLGHISFFGLGFLNLCFFFTVRAWEIGPGPGLVGSWGFALGALTMPVCCLMMAHWPKWHLLLFAVPVSSLAAAVGATLWGVAGHCLV